MFKIKLVLKLFTAVAITVTSLFSFASFSNPRPAFAACSNIVYNYAMQAPNGTETWIIFGASQQTSAQKLGSVKLTNGKSYDITTLANQGTAIAVIPKASTYSFTFFESNITCTGLSVVPIAYSAEKDPYKKAPTNGEGWQVVSEASGTKVCQKTGNGPFATQAMCEARGIGGLQGFDPPCNPTCKIGGIIELDPGNGGQTAIESILKAAIALASLVSFIIAGFGAVQIVFSQGASGKISEGKDKIVSAIAGLLFIVFSITILQIIGVSVLKLPGLGN